MTKADCDKSFADDFFFFHIKLIKIFTLIYKQELLIFQCTWKAFIKWVKYNLNEVLYWNCRGWQKLYFLLLKYYVNCSLKN